MDTERLEPIPFLIDNGKKPDFDKNHYFFWQSWLEFSSKKDDDFLIKFLNGLQDILLDTSRMLGYDENDFNFFSNRTPDGISLFFYINTNFTDIPLFCNQKTRDKIKSFLIENGVIFMNSKPAIVYSYGKDLLGREISN